MNTENVYVVIEKYRPFDIINNTVYLDYDTACTAAEDESGELEAISLKELMDRISKEVF